MNGLIEKINASYEALKADAELQAEKGNKAAGTRAVSYTHLDVYKRQAQTLYRLFQNGLPRTIAAGATALPC